MHRSRISPLAGPFVFASLLTAAFAQSSTTDGSVSATATGQNTASGSITRSATRSSTASATPKVHTVKVGNGGFTMDPAELTDVNVGDTVTFDFYPPDHSVARASFGSACVPYEYTTKDVTGFFSGQKFFDDPLNPIPWNITINSTEPIFYYCTAPGSCIDHQMVGVINPNDTFTLEKQIESAKNADFMVAPGDKIPSEASSTMSIPSSMATSEPTSTSEPAHNNHPHKLSGGAIAGIVIGAVAFLAICAALFFYVGRTKSLKEVLERKDATVKPTPQTPGSEFPPGSPGYPSPFSPHHSQAEYGVPPNYSQHHVAEQHPSGWTSPPMHPGHMSLTPQPQMAEVKPETQQYAPAEMPSPGPQQQTFTAELEAPIKSPR